MVIVDALPQDDWDATYIETTRLQSQQKIIYYQPYAPGHEDSTKKPFAVVIQDDFMNKMAKMFSIHNFWAFDSNFKTNQNGLPLYTAIVPNEDGNDIPIFYMLCSIDKHKAMKE